MFLKKSKYTDKFLWTNHSLGKMRFYRLSESRIKRIVKNPQRIEEGIAPETIAVMQRNDKKNKKEEIWVMYQPTKQANFKSQISKLNNRKIRIISAWRYPGISPLRKPPPIPIDILEELFKEFN